MLNYRLVVIKVSPRPGSNKDARATETDQVGSLSGVVEVVQMEEVGVDTTTGTI